MVPAVPAMVLAGGLVAPSGSTPRDGTALPVCVAEHRAEIGDHLGSEFTATVSDHFAMVYAADHPSPETIKRTAALLERAHRQFYDSLEAAGFEPRPPSGPLVWVSLTHPEQFNRYARRADRMDLSWLDGYYSARTNRVVVTQNHFVPQYGSDDGGDGVISIERATHELAHQIAFNSGVQTRGVMYPLWVSEGLATNLEADASGAFGLGRDNPGRRERLLRAQAAGRLVPIAEFLTLTRVPPHDSAAANDLYAQAWGVFRFLLDERRPELQRYLAALSGLKPGWRDPQTLRREVVEAFGAIAPLAETWDLFLAQLAVLPQLHDKRLLVERPAGAAVGD